MNYRFFFALPSGWKMTDTSTFTTFLSTLKLKNVLKMIQIFLNCLNQQTTENITKATMLFLIHGIKKKLYAMHHSK